MEEKMCTSFVAYEPELTIAMNFDSDGRDARLMMDGSFICSLNMGQRYFPSFGVSSAGNFINDLMVDYDERGKYKRQSQKRWVNSQLVEKVLYDRISAEEFHGLLEEVQIVYPPHSFTHNLLIDKQGNTYIIEPGFGYSWKSSSSRECTVLTNFQLEKLNGSDESPKSGLDRYHVVSEEMKRNPVLGLERAFELLNKARQDSKEWKTELSFVYLPNQQAVYFAVLGSFDRLFRYDLAENKLFKDKGFDGRDEIPIDRSMLSIEELGRIS
jgi:hypothetical protein